MRRCSVVLGRWLAQRPKLIVRPELFTIVLASGTVLYYTDWPASISIPQADGSTLTWKGGDVLIGGAKFKAQIGATADQQDLTVNYHPPSDAAPSVIGETPFVQAIQSGFFDNSYFYRDVAYWASIQSIASGAPPIGNLSLDQYGATSDGRINLFTGRISALSDIGKIQATFSVKDDRVLLDSDYPRNNYGTQCRHVLYDSGCTLSKADFSHAGVCAAGSTAAVLQWATGQTPNYFAKGEITFTSGANEGTTRLIQNSTTTSLTLMPPLNATPASGDTFTASAGCPHTRAVCQGRFNNLAHFNGYPFVPPPATTIS